MYARFLPILLLLATSCLSAQEPGTPPAVPQTLEQADALGMSVAAQLRAGGATG